MPSTNPIFTLLYSLAAGGVLAFALWPKCADGTCKGLFLGGNFDANLFSIIMLVIMILIPFIYGIVGIVKYSMGYGLGKFGQSSKLTKDASQDRKNMLLITSIPVIVITGALLIVILFNLQILLSSVH